MDRYSIDIFHILVLWKYWNLKESRIWLKPVLGACELLHFPLVIMNRLNKTESAVFEYCRFSLFLKVPFFQIIKIKIYERTNGPITFDLGM